MSPFAPCLGLVHCRAWGPLLLTSLTSLVLCQILQTYSWGLPEVEVPSPGCLSPGALESGQDFTPD